MSAVADVLNGAADLIESGRAKWKQAPVSGGVCAALAMGRSNAMNGPAPDVVFVMARHLGWKDGERDPLGYIFRWNDAPGRTKAEVVAALRTAAERAA